MPAHAEASSATARRNGPRVRRRTTVVLRGFGVQDRGWCHRLCYHRRDEAIALAWNRLDHPFSVTLPLQHLAQSGDVHRKVRLLDEGVGPDLLQQFVLGDEMSAVADEDDEQIEGLARQRDRFPVAQQ